MTLANRLNSGRPPLPPLNETELAAAKACKSYDEAAATITAIRIRKRDGKPVSRFWIRSQLVRQKIHLGRKPRTHYPDTETTKPEEIRDTRDSRLPEHHMEDPDEPSNNGKTFVNRSPTEGPLPVASGVESEQSSSGRAVRATGLEPADAPTNEAGAKA